MDYRIVCVLFMCVLVTGANSIPDQETTPAETTESSTITSTENAEIETDDDIGNTTDITLASASPKDLKNELYKLITSRKYDKAVKKAVAIYNMGYTNVIKGVVDRLIDSGNVQLFEFAYQVTKAKADNIADACFPLEIRVHEDPVYAQIINHEYGCALEYGDSEDWAGDKILYCHVNIATSRNSIEWKFEPEWQGNKLYFRLRSVGDGMYMKLGTERDSDSDHLAYGSRNSDSARHLWYLKPARYEGSLYIYIINKEYDELLKAGVELKRFIRHRTYGQSKKQLKPVKQFGWDFFIKRSN